MDFMTVVFRRDQIAYFRVLLIRMHTSIGRSFARNGLQFVLIDKPIAYVGVDIHQYNLVANCCA